ncbi:type IV toxin-antitoxin system AbiEi family antitoxin domain-containing protein [Nocardioides caeni]|uniref:type IV toxin-antitoxin system AbiEi family antitoxin domain-containing protein n=1 Tax=Nocardioides caeni TaxID=574700 RepID=UPI001930EA94
MATRIDLGHPRLAQLLRAQCGVLSRAQLIAAGAGEGDITRMRRRKEIRRVHSGVYVDHTGPLTYEQREWVAVLAAWPAALCGESAIPGRRPQVVEVAVERGRTVAVPDGPADGHRCALRRVRAHRGTARSCVPRHPGGV